MTSTWPMRITLSVRPLAALSFFTVTLNRAPIELNVSPDFTR